MASFRKYFYNNVLPFSAMVTVEITNVGLNILFKAASLKGMSYYVYTVYSYSIATLLLLLLPMPFTFQSVKQELPSLKLPLLSRIGLLSVIGFLAQILGRKGIECSSPTLASAMSNLTPAFTFTLAVIFRMEKLDLRNSCARAKIMGTVLSILGALVVVLCKGPMITSTHASPAPTPSASINRLLASESNNSNWVIGGVLFGAQNFLYSIGYILQAGIMQMYRNELIVTFLYTLFVTFISIPVGFVAEKNLDAWHLRPEPDIAVAAIVYAGFFGSCFGTFIHTWCLRMKGPFYVVIFDPMSIAIAAVMGVIFLKESFYLWSVIGAVIISVGFYAVIWGKAYEKTANKDHGLDDSSVPEQDDRVSVKKAENSLQDRV